MNNAEENKETTTTAQAAAAAEAPKAEGTPTPEAPKEEPKAGWFKRIFWSKTAKITYGVIGLGALGVGAALLYDREAAETPAEA